MATKKKVKQKLRPVQLYLEDKNLVKQFEDFCTKEKRSESNAGEFIFHSFFNKK